MRVPPFWEYDKPESLADVVHAVGTEGYERLFIKPSDEILRYSLNWTIEKGLSREDAIRLDSFHNTARQEAAEMGVRLGWGLAMSLGHLGSFDDWLEAAIIAAGLVGYTPNIRHYIFEDDEQPDQAETDNASTVGEQQDFLAWLDAQQKVPVTTKRWMSESYTSLAKARDTGRMTQAGFDIAVDLLRLIAESYQAGTEDRLLDDLKGISHCIPGQM